MTDETQMLSKPGTREEPAGDSHFLKVSVRAWLAILLLFTVCAHSVAAIALAVILRQPELLKVTEPLYTMSGMALAYYFGQQKTNAGKTG